MDDRDERTNSHRLLGIDVADRTREGRHARIGTARVVYRLASRALVHAADLVAGIALDCVLARIALPLLSFAALLLPMMTLQTIMQVRAGATFGPTSAAPSIGFAIVSAGAIGYLSRLARSVSLSGSKVVAGA